MEALHGRRPPQSVRSGLLFRHLDAYLNPNIRRNRPVALIDFE
jgi:hypothetical protein